MARSPLYYQQFRQIKKAHFLEKFRDYGNVRLAADAIGIDRTTVYVWIEHDEQFALAYQQAKIDAIEALEAEAHRRAVLGTRRDKGVYHLDKLIATETITEYSDTLLIFLLKGLAPEKYRDNVNVTQTQIIKTVDAEAWDKV